MQIIVSNIKLVYKINVRINPYLWYNKFVHVFMSEELMTIWKVPISRCTMKEGFICVCFSCKGLESIKQKE